GLRRVTRTRWSATMRARDTGRIGGRPGPSFMSSRGVPSWRCQRSADLLVYKPLVRKIAGRLRARLSSNVGIDELEQAGLIGLNVALTRFEEGRGSSFETYAARRIEGGMLDSL